MESSIKILKDFKTFQEHHNFFFEEENSKIQKTKMRWTTRILQWRIIFQIIFQAIYAKIYVNFLHLRHFQ